MCGFFFIKKNGLKFNLSVLKSHSDLLKHRGPDDNRTFNNEDIYARFFRLSILDTSINGSQPMFDRSKRYMLLFNGEIYNFLELKQKLKNKRFVSNSDTEILLYSLIEKGTSALKNLDGMFSFIFYDLKKNELLFARDRLGIKPLYYTFFKKSFIFSSEIKSLVPFVNELSVKDSSFCDFFFKGSMDHNHETFFKNIFSVEPGQLGKIRGQKIDFKKYWKLSKIENNSHSFNKNKLELKYLLKKSIEKHMISDRKIGVFLSGGTDSNAILNLMLETNNTKKIPTFSYGFKGSLINSELPRVRKLLQNKNATNSSHKLTPEDIIKNFDNMTLTLESPFTSVRLFAMKKLYEIASMRNCKVVIEGDGGDEIFGGYDYNIFSFLKDKHKNIGGEKKILNELVKFLNNSKKIHNIINLILTNTYQFSSTSDGTIFVNSDLFNKDYLNKNLNEKFYEYKENNNFNHLQNSQIKDLFFIKLPRTLKYKDRLSMSEGVEARVPLLDHKLVEFAFNLPNKYKFHKLNSRYIFKNLFDKKNNFEFSKRSIADPQKLWLKTSLKEFFIDNISSSDFKKLKYFDQRNIKKEFLNFCKNENYPTTFNFFQILSFYRFHQKFKNFKSKIK